ncbi:hypothetical protein [Williamsia sterculiae]|uniref:Uncharacterized protein n=1 Tax=Williamsia sterculiae TaxID=1344003 RepID=A0A1N7FCJ6_9NOCA|nr:hypothetical protein [Williamsia sterculiae]SIR98059.1 hypothetical protein SAMN05445060_1932 [Williamsia sterculiae]
MRSLDGFDYFARVISNLPRPGFPGEFAQEELVAERFLQVGGVSDAVTLDIRKDSEDGSTQHIYKLGHKPLAKHADENPDVEIRLGEHVEHVYAHELFTSDEAARIFHFYYKNNDVSDKYALRQLPM